MSEFFELEELVGDVDEDAFELFNPETKASSGNFAKDDIERKSNKTTPSLPKAKCLNENKTSKVQPKGDDLLQALSLGAIFTPSIQKVAKLEPGVKVQSKKPAKGSTSSKVKIVTSSKEVETASDASEIKTGLSTSDQGIQKPTPGDPTDRVERNLGQPEAILTDKKQETNSKEKKLTEEICEHVNLETVSAKMKKLEEKHQPVKIVKKSEEKQLGVQKNQTVQEQPGGKRHVFDVFHGNARSEVWPFEHKDNLRKDVKRDATEDPRPGSAFEKTLLNDTTKACGRKMNDAAQAKRPTAALQKKIPEIKKGENNEKRRSSSSSTSLKRKHGHNAKSSPTESKSSNFMTSTSTEVDSRTETTIFTEEDRKNIDLYLVDKMVESLTKKNLPPYRPSDSRFRVKVSPLEVADLAEISVQSLIREYPMMSIIFKRQIGKFKKKKGHAEFNFTKVFEVKDFVKKLIPLKLTEKKIEVTITAWYSGITQELSFHLALDENRKLMALINSDQDPHNKMIGSKGSRLQFELVPASVTVLLLQSIFPFCTYVRITRDTTCKLSGKSMIGPIFIHYNNHEWLDAVMGCLSHFTIDGYSLVMLDKDRKQNLRESMEGNEKEQSMKDGQRDKNIANHSSVKLTDDKGISDEENEDDDAVSNMTRDVCTGMLESLDRLRQLDASNPNIERILKMRDQLDKLQKSLGPEKEEKTDAVSHEMEKRGGHHANVWEAIQDDMNCRMENSAMNTTKQTESDAPNSGLKPRNSKKHAHDEKLMESTWHQRKKAGTDGGCDMRQTRNFSAVMTGRKIETSGQRQDHCARKFNDQRRRADLELEQQTREEQARKEAERMKLIQKIEEARLRDIRKAEERAQNSSVWKSNSNIERKRESPFSHKKAVAEKHSHVSFSDASKDHGFERGNNRPMKRQLEETYNSQDDGVDQRLAAFEQELAEKGVIQTHAPSPKRAKKISSDSFIMSDDLAGVPIYMEDEYENIIAEGKFNALPHNYRVRILSSSNRRCPVKSCPNTKYFRDIRSFLDHWSTFHVPETTMRFCQKCVAYFSTADELEMHLMKLHWINQSEANFMVQKARVKVISNPSFRDPAPFLLPID